MAVSDSTISFAPRGTFTAGVVLWFALVSWAVYQLLRDPVSGPSAGSTVAANAVGVALVSAGLAAASSWAIGSAVLLFNVCHATRRRLFKKPFFEWGALYVLVTAFGIASLWLPD